MIALLLLLAQEDASAKPAWGRMLSPVVEDFSSLFFFDRRTGWILSEGGGVLKTIDGGVSWKTCREGGLVKRNRPFEHIWFENELRGWVVQCRSDCELAGNQPVRAFVTEDGGESWAQREDIPASFPGWSEGVTVSTGERWGRGHQGSVLFGLPGEKKSTIANDHPKLAAFGKTFDTHYSDVAFATPDVGVLVGSDVDGKLVLRSEDGGATWTRQNLPGLRAKWIRRVWMSGTSEARIVPDGGESLWATRDAGRTWEVEWSGKPGEGIEEIAFGFAIGKRGLILRRSVTK
jgi:hypothetical protein